MIGILTITNPELNTNNPINLLANDLSVSWEIYTKTQGTPKKDADGTLNAGLGRGINTGFNNPTITIQGRYNLDTAHTTGASATIDYEWLKELVRRSDQTLTLTNDAFITTSDVVGTMSVLLKNVTFDNGNSNVINFTMSFVRVKEE